MSLQGCVGTDLICSLLGSGANLRFLGTSYLLLLVLPLLALLGRVLLDGEESVTYKPMLGLKLLGEVKAIVDERKAGGLAATERRAEAEAEDNVWCGLVHSSHLFTNFSFGYSGTTRV